MATTDNNSTSKTQAWFCTTGLPSDILVDVQDISFHLHKFPLMSKSKKLHDLITAEEQNPNSSLRSQPLDEESSAGGDEIEEVHCQITLSDFPGGSDTFEMVAKFCYGVKIDLNASTVVLLRCAGEYLSMTEEFCEDNLISKTERFLSSSVLKSLHDSIKALKSCERVASLAETLAITQRCIDSIVSKASSSDPSLFGWPVTDNNPTTANDRRSRASTIANSWIHDLAMLNLEYFTGVVQAMQQRDLSPDIIEPCLIYYAKKHIPGVSRSNRKQSLSSASTQSDAEQRELLETIISNLPLNNISRSSTSAITRFLFGLLKTAIILNTKEQCRLTLEKKIGAQLDKATLDDLLIPSYSYLNETLYDVDCFERILGFFLNEVEDGTGDDRRSPELMLVGKLVDGYLAEIASDANLKPDRFYDLAVSLPEQARLFDDGLYRAVDIFLKAHPRITETEKEKICGLLDYQKLTLEACTHAAQNERLPLRAVVQVLFFEQLQLRHAIAGTLVTTEETGGGRVSVVEEEEEEEEEVRTGHVRSTWREAVRENQVMRVEMDSMRTRVHQLERECSNMRKVIEKVEGNEKSTRGGGSWRESLTKKFGCKFKIQVCDSHEQTVVNTRRVRNHHKQQ